MPRHGADLAGSNPLPSYSSVEERVGFVKIAAAPCAVVRKSEMLRIALVDTKEPRKSPATEFHFPIAETH